MSHAPANRDVSDRAFDVAFRSGVHGGSFADIEAAFLGPIDARLRELTTRAEEERSAAAAARDQVRRLADDYRRLHEEIKPTQRALAGIADRFPVPQPSRPIVLAAVSTWVAVTAWLAVASGLGRFVAVGTVAGQIGAAASGIAVAALLFALVMRFALGREKALRRIASASSTYVLWAGLAGAIEWVATVDLLPAAASLVVGGVGLVVAAFGIAGAIKFVGIESVVVREATDTIVCALDRSAKDLDAAAARLTEDAVRPSRLSPSFVRVEVESFALRRTLVSGYQLGRQLQPARHSRGPARDERAGTGDAR